MTEIWLDNGRSKDLHEGNLCRECERYVSKAESELRSLVKEHYDGTIITNTRDIIPPLELDIWIPELSLAFEFDGLYYHNSAIVKPNYHVLKTTKCEEKGI